MQSAHFPVSGTEVPLSAWGFCDNWKLPPNASLTSTDGFSLVTVFLFPEPARAHAWVRWPS